ncbi:MAG: nucleotidyltransferase family protein [Pseudohongiella sp.]|nr:nucleotidyltransferase family protein [Pseudohongiella sp.]
MTTADHPSPSDRSSDPLQTHVTGAILLAAGFSRRFGAIKLQARLPDGCTLLQRCFRNLLQATDNIIVVGRTDLQSTGTYEFLPEQAGVKLVLCEDAESGMGHSLACAVKQIPESWQSALICLGDMPLIRSETLKSIIAASSVSSIVIPVWHSQRGHPVSFGREYFPELAASRGDSGGRQIIKQHGSHIRELPTDDPGVVQDIDTPEALRLLMSVNSPC